MTDKILMTINPCNCLTCTNAIQEHEESRFRLCKVVDCYVLMFFDGKYIPYTQTAQDIMKCGCISHPGARDWLMRDVLQELEGRIEANDGFCGTYDENERARLTSLAYKRAIALIRGDGK